MKDGIRPLFHEKNQANNAVSRNGRNLMFEDSLIPSAEDISSQNNLPDPLIPHLTSSAQRQREIHQREARQKEEDHIRRLFSTPPRNKKKRRSIDSNVALSNVASSPFAPSQSTRHRKAERKRLQEEREQQESDDEGSPSGSPSGSGAAAGQFKKFRKWEKF